MAKYSRAVSKVKRQSQIPKSETYSQDEVRFMLGVIDYVIQICRDILHIKYRRDDFSWYGSLRYHQRDAFYENNYVCIDRVRSIVTIAMFYTFERCGKELCAAAVLLTDVPYCTVKKGYVKFEMNQDEWKGICENGKREILTCGN